MKKGCPVTRRRLKTDPRGGAVPYHFTLKKVQVWCLAQGIDLVTGRGKGNGGKKAATRMAKGAGSKATKAPAKPKGKKKSGKPKGKAKPVEPPAPELSPAQLKAAHAKLEKQLEKAGLLKPGVGGMVERLRTIELESYLLVAHARKGKDPMMSAAMQKLYLDAEEALRKAEKDLTGILGDQGDVIPRIEAEAAFRRVAGMIRADMLSLPQSLAPRCEKLEVAEISIVLRDGIHDALRHLADSEIQGQVA